MTSHNMSRTKTYRIWAGMIQRCTYKKHIHYKYYGGRGIDVCESWRSFENFFNDMGERPSECHSIDRIDNNGDYEPNNCRWVTMEKQSQNKRAYQSSKTGISGVRWNKQSQKWQADISRNGLRKFLGYFDCFFDACCARKSAEVKV